MDFPVSTEDFAVLAAQGLTVIYTETASRDVAPGEGWFYWGELKTDTDTKAIWRKIVTVEESLAP